MVDIVRVSSAIIFEVSCRSALSHILQPSCFVITDHYICMRLYYIIIIHGCRTLALKMYLLLFYFLLCDSIDYN